MHTTLRALDPCGWYFDSGCSRHITGDRTLFTTFKGCSVGTVTFGDGNTSTISGKSKIKFSEIGELKNILYVKGLAANLLNPSLMCFSAVTDEAIISSQLDDEETNFEIAGEKKEPTIHEKKRVENLGGKGEEVEEDENEELEVTPDEGILAPSLDIPTSSSSRVRSSHPVNNVIVFESKNVDEALQNSDWLMAMQEELLQFAKNDV
ncbi:uncharacterized protein LOC132274494 [Cornus florida]|uniref:uncharacterized protein LOC132274494 n=1 Tax=Cornus florida TaxID=4283 RepID=UPI002898C242|nr:uncharacterized protein LOC132274494 [Cornus florida]